MISSNQHIVRSRNLELAVSFTVFGALVGCGGYLGWRAASTLFVPPVQLFVAVDPGTGCQYLVIGTNEIRPRMGVDGNQICIGETAQ